MAIITARVDDKTKTALYKVAEEIGIPVSALFNAWAKELVRTKKVEISLYGEYLEDMEMYPNKDVLEKKLKRSAASGGGSLVI